MFSIGQELYLEIDLKKAKLAQLRLRVQWIDTGEIADYGGPIEEIKTTAIKINGRYYAKHLCRFYVR